MSYGNKDKHGHKYCSNSKNIRPVEKLLFGKNTPHESIRIARAGDVPTTTDIAKHAGRLKI